MGAILKVWDEELRRHVAMKVLLNRRADPERDAEPVLDSLRLGRFLEEAQITAQLDHPGVVPVHELGLTSDGQVYFTMRLVKGQDFRTVIDLARAGKDGWGQPRALTVLQRVCEAMAFAHSKGVIHRDLKPANIMVGRFGETYVMDWGLARVIGKDDPMRAVRPAGVAVSLTAVHSVRTDEAGSPDSPLLTDDGDVIGTPVYMPPEQAMGVSGDVGPTADVYSVGAILYHLCTGRMPYVEPGAQVSPYTVLRWLQEGPPLPIHKIDPSVPAELAAICDKAMARRPRDRYPDMQAMAEDVRAYLEGRVVKAHRVGALVELHKWTQRNRVAALSVAAAALLAIGGLGSVAAIKAESSRRIASALADLELVSADAFLLKYAEEARDLGPATPANAPRLRAWLEKARALAERAPAFRELRDEIRARSIGSDPNVPEPPDLADLRQVRQDLASAIPALETSGQPATEIEKVRRRIESLDARIAGSEERLASRRAWRFAGPRDQERHDQLDDLALELDRLAAERTEGGLIDAIARRLELAETIEARSIGAFGDEWKEAIDAIGRRDASSRYAGLRIAPQLGLVPLGVDPLSSLWEFAHVGSGEIPARAENGTLRIDESSAIVLVLLPGGRFTMGARRPAAREPASGSNVDPSAQVEEGPSHEIELEPFFLSKYETTQGQWRRMTGVNPSQFLPGSRVRGETITLLHPVEQVSWSECRETLSAFGLEIPTEAQWEYGSRAGTGTVWWSGDDVSSLQGAANLPDLTARERGAPESWGIADLLEDGYLLHSPVGRFDPNRFGLHDTIGNVWEWCRDTFASYRLPVRMGNGERRALGSNDCVFRGGSHASPIDLSRSAARAHVAPETRVPTLGVRASRSVMR